MTKIPSYRVTPCRLVAEHEAWVAWVIAEALRIAAAAAKRDAMRFAAHSNSVSPQLRDAVPEDHAAT